MSTNTEALIIFKYSAIKLHDMDPIKAEWLSYKNVNLVMVRNFSLIVVINLEKYGFQAWGTVCLEIYHKGSFSMIRHNKGSSINYVTQILPFLTPSLSPNGDSP